MEKKYMVYIGGFKLPDKNAAAHRVGSISTIFERLGYGVHYIQYDREYEEKTDVHDAIDNIKLDSISKKIKHAFFIEEWQYIKKILKTKDINAIVLYNYPALPTLIGLHLCKSRGIKVIADCTEWHSSTGFNKLKSMLKSVDIFLRMRIMNFHVDGMIVISDFLLDYYKSRKKDIVIVKIPPLVDLDTAEWDFRKNEIIMNKPRRFIYAGTPFSNRKNIKDDLTTIITNFATLKNEGLNFLFRIVGLTKSDYLSVFPEMSGLVSNLEPNIAFLGKLKHDETLNEIFHSDYSVFFRNESLITKAGFPTKLIESIACGIPAITNDVYGNIQKAGLNISKGKGLILSNYSQNEVYEMVKRAINLEDSELAALKSDNLIAGNLITCEAYIKEVEDFLGGVGNGN